MVQNWRFLNLKNVWLALSPLPIVDAFKAYCDEENLECTVVADVTDTNRLIMNWNGETIVDISRDFLNTMAQANSKKL